MVLWLVVAPGTVLLLGLAGANWKVVHLTYCRHLLRSEDPDRMFRGMSLLLETHAAKGMTLREVSDLLRPARLHECTGCDPETYSLRMEISGGRTASFSHILKFERDAMRWSSDHFPAGCTEVDPLQFRGVRIYPRQRAGETAAPTTGSR